jgi:hypothetical protein
MSCQPPFSSKICIPRICVLIGTDDEPQQIQSHLGKAETGDQNVYLREIKAIKYMGYCIAFLHVIKNKEFNHLNSY